MGKEYTVSGTTSTTKVKSKREVEAALKTFIKLFKAAIDIAIKEGDTQRFRNKFNEAIDGWRRYKNDHAQFASGIDDLFLQVVDAAAKGERQEMRRYIGRLIDNVLGL